MILYPCIFTHTENPKDFRGLIVRAKDVKKSLVYTPINKMFGVDFLIKTLFLFYEDPKTQAFFSLLRQF